MVDITPTSVRKSSLSIPATQVLQQLPMRVHLLPFPPHLISVPVLTRIIRFQDDHPRVPDLDWSFNGTHAFKWKTTYACATISPAPGRNDKESKEPPDNDDPQKPPPNEEEHRDEEQDDHALNPPSPTSEHLFRSRPGQVILAAIPIGLCLCVSCSSVLIRSIISLFGRSIQVSTSTATLPTLASSAACVELGTSQSRLSYAFHSRKHTIFLHQSLLSPGRVYHNT
jgi:hypothetical protein